MENVEEKKKEYTIDDFRREIEELSKNPENEGDFPEEIKPGELTETDMRYWAKIQDGTITKSDILEYRKKFENEYGFENKTRYNFLMFVANKANVIIGKRELSQ